MTGVQTCALPIYTIKDADAGFDDPAVLEDNPAPEAEAQPSDEVDFDE